MIDFIEYVGKKKKKVTHVEVNSFELNEMWKGGNFTGQAQFRLF